MKFVSCGVTKSKKMYLFVAFPVFWILSFFLENQLQNKENNTQFVHFGIKLVIIYSGKLFSGIFELISLQLQKKSFNNQKKNVSTIPTISPVIRNKPKTLTFKKHNFLFIGLVIILEIGTKFWNNQLKQDNFEQDLHYKYQYKGYQIIPTALLYKCIILKNHFYKHHLISIVMMVILLCLISINTLCFKVEKVNIISLMWQYICIFTLISIENIIEKWIIDLKSLSVFVFCFYQGIIGGTLTAIICLCLSLIPNLDINPSFVDEMKRIFNNSLVIIFFLNMISSSGYHIFILLISKHYTPVHKTICECVYTFILVLYSMIKDEQIDTLIIIGYICCFCLLVVFALIYNEIIILHCWELDKNTFSKISLRGDNEMEKMNEALYEDNN